jgi:trans-aconitate methyltransferase
MQATWLDRFRSLLPPYPAVFDIGCGSAEPTGRHLIEQPCALTGVDSALEMIAVYKR